MAPSPPCSSRWPLPRLLCRPLGVPLRRPVLLLPAVLALLVAVPWASGAAVSHRDEENGANSVRHELAAYDNEIISEPSIECGPGLVHFNVDTRKGNASSVYVRGQSQNADCTFHNTRNVTIELSKCNVRRKREVNPNPGIAYQMTIVVQLHPLFVTKVDRAYNVNCFYKEQKQDVSIDFGVNELDTEQVQSEAIIPNCTYSVHRDSPNGPRVKYTHVGEQLYHVWHCPSKMYSMMLYNCNAVDGKGGEYAIVDANGCSKDEFLMPQITYTEDRTKAMAASAAFNFPDRNTMSFTCKIKLCMNKEPECATLTPPSCNGRRAKSAANGNFNVDMRAANVSEQSTSTVATPPTPKRERMAVSGEVEAEFDETSSTPRATRSSTTASSTTTRGSTPTSTPTTTTASSSTSGTTTTTRQQTSTSTGEQLLSSVERMASSEQASAEQRQHESGTSHSPKSNVDDFPADFPRPDLLLQNDRAPRTKTTRMERLHEKEDASWTMSAEEHEISTMANEEFRGTTRPVHVFKKAKGAEGEDKEKQAGRAQRDATTRPAKGQAKGRKSGGTEVDFDIASPELMIMDDYEPAAAAQKAGTGNSIEEAPLIFDWADSRRPPNASGVCFSPAALMCAGGLLLVLVLAMAFVVAKTVRKGAGGMMAEHSFYSH